MYLGRQGDTLATIGEIADYHGISRNHLVKVVHHLAHCGFVQTTRGKKGGLRLARSPNRIGLGEVIRRTESNFHIVECFSPDKPACPIQSYCALQDVLAEASGSFLKVLDSYTIADLLNGRHSTGILRRVEVAGP